MSSINMICVGKDPVFDYNIGKFFFCACNKCDKRKNLFDLTAEQKYLEKTYEISRKNGSMCRSVGESIGQTEHNV